MAESNGDKSTANKKTDTNFNDQTTNIELSDLKIRAEKAEAALDENKNNFNAYRKERMKQEIKLEEKNGQIRILEGREEAFNVDKEAMQSRIGSLVNRLKDARDANTHQEEGYNAEIKVQTGLANCFKTKASDGEEKCSELTEAVETLQNLLNTSSEKYGTLEASLENEKKEKEEEINRRNEAIRVLRKELDDANELIKTLKHDVNSENMKLISPSAAAASKAVKSGTRLTQIYSQLLTCQEDLANEKKEHQLLKEYNDELETERQLNASEKEENENMKRKYLGVVREKERFKLQTKDLSTQVTTLTREVEAARFGHTTFGKNESLRVSSPTPKESVTNTEKVLSERLISFHSVSELQTKNIELLVFQ